MSAECVRISDVACMYDLRQTAPVAFSCIMWTAISREIVWNCQRNSSRAWSLHRMLAQSILVLLNSRALHCSAQMGLHWPGHRLVRAVDICRRKHVVHTSPLKRAMFLCLSVACVYASAGRVHSAWRGANKFGGVTVGRKVLKGCLPSPTARTESKKDNWPPPAAVHLR